MGGERGVGPPSIYEGLRAVSGLRYGRSEARETEPIKPVPDEHVDAILPYVTPHISAMIRVQRLTGMRPEEVVSMRPCDISTSDAVWVYKPAQHKKRWLDREALIPLGPVAQEILSPFMERNDGAFLFSPQEAEEWRKAQRRRNRKTPMTPSQAKRRPKSKPKRAKRDYYDTDSYRRAIKYGIKKANRERTKQGLDEVPSWFPYQLRHSFGTSVRKDYGYESAQVYLGHIRTNVTDVYAEKNLDLAIEIARKIG